MKELATAFVKAQKQFSPALKTNTNPHFKSKYVSLDGCIEAVIDALNSNGISLIQKTLRDDAGVTVKTIFLHESGQELDGGELHVPATKQDAQGYGSALTYARRYSLMAACGIAPEDDDGNAASTAKTASTVSAKHSPVPAGAIPPARAAIIDDVAQAMRDKYKASDIVGAFEEASSITDGEEKIALWTMLKPDSDLRAAIKKHGETLKGQQ